MSSVKFNAADHADVFPATSEARTRKYHTPSPSWGTTVCCVFVVFENVLSWVRSKLYRVVVAKMKTGGFNNPFVELEHLGVNKNWSDTEIYQHFNLTAEEISYVEQNIE